MKSATVTILPAVREPLAEASCARAARASFPNAARAAANPQGPSSRDRGDGTMPFDVDAGRNLRSVWSIATGSFDGAHFAVMPEALVEPCVRAGTSVAGCCAACGAPVERVVEVSGETARDRTRKVGVTARGNGTGLAPQGLDHVGGHGSTVRPRQPVAWRPTCACPAAASPAGRVPCTVLDPFGGAGTVAVVARRLGRSAVMVELNPDYVEIARRRIDGDLPSPARADATSAAPSSPSAPTLDPDPDPDPVPERVAARERRDAEGGGA